MGQGPPAKPPPVLPKYVQHVAEPSVSYGPGGETPMWKSPPAEWVENHGGKAAARGAAAMGTSSKSMASAKSYGGSPPRPTPLASAWPDEPPPWGQTPKYMAMPRPPVEPGEDPHRGYENPWDRPHWPQAPRLIPPYGGEEDTLTLHPRFGGHKPFLTRCNYWWTRKRRNSDQSHAQTCGTIYGFRQPLG